MNRDGKKKGASTLRIATIVIVVTASLYWLPAIFFGSNGIDWGSVAIYAASLFVAALCWVAGGRKG